MPVAQVFKALGDPTRLEMVRRLSSGSVYTIGVISSDLGLTRQAARKHLQVLVNAHLITLETEGRSAQVKLKAESLEEVKDFIATLELRWEKRLEALREYIEQ